MDVREELRQALINDFADRLYEKLTDPQWKKEYVDQIEKCVINITKTENRLYPDNQVSEEEVKSRRGDVEQFIFDSEIMKSYCELAALGAYKTREELNQLVALVWKEVDEAQEKISADGLTPGNRAPLQQALERAYKSVNDIEMFIDALLPVAEKEGIGSAVALETQDKVIRNLFTPEEYKIHLLTTLASSKEISTACVIATLPKETTAANKEIKTSLEDAMTALGLPGIEQEIARIYAA